MAWEYGFFNSVNGDRTYNAQQMSRIFEGLITTGVYASVGNKMAVQPNDGMAIQIATGRGWFNQHWVSNDTEYIQTLEESDVILNRYCAVCVRVDDTESERSATPYFKYSEFATSPDKPTMERGENVNEYCLAYVYIRAGAEEITEADIEDTRGDNELCGWVTGLIEQLSTTTLFTQWSALFNDWFNNLHELINENTETMLVSAMPTSLTITLAADKWTSAETGYQQAVKITGMTETKGVIVQPTFESDTAYSASEVRCISQAANELTFTAVTQPTEAINVNVMHMGV